MELNTDTESSGAQSGEAVQPGEAQPDSNLSGMNPAAAKEYIFNFITTLKLTEKQIADLDEDLAGWQSRIELAKSKARPELAAEAEKELERLTVKRRQLICEAGSLKTQIEEMRRQLPLLAARERSVDPDLLEQELLIAAGRMPGDEEKARNERQLKDLEKDAAADAALSELKAKMGKLP
jgi:phage shock protein A